MSSQAAAPMNVRVLIVDDDLVVRQSLTKFVDSVPDLTVVGTAQSGAEVVALAEMLRPDVVLMDLRMPGVGGISATRALRRAEPKVKVLVITAFGDHDAVDDALRAGASGFLLKTAKPHEVVDSIRLISRGHGVLPADEVARHWTDGNHPERNEKAPALTPREAEVLAALGRGLSNRAIAEELHVGESTVKLHFSTLMNKLGVSSRVQVLVRAHALGLVKT